MNTFVDTYDRVYSVRKWTFEHLYCIFVYFIIFALPFYFSFAGKNFWFDQQYAKLQARYYYSGYYAVQLTYLNNSVSETRELAVIPSSTIASLQGLKVSVEDTTTASTFVFELNNFNLEISSANFIVYFDVEVPSLKRVVSVGCAVGVTGNFGVATVSGQIGLKVAEPFNALTTASTTTINRPAYFDINYRAPNSYSDLIDAHLDNPYKLESQSFIYSLSEPTTLSGTTRTLTLNLLKDTSLLLPYYPPILETLKFKFSTYFGMLMLSYLIFSNLLSLLIKNQALECHIRDEVANTLAMAKKN